MMIQSIRLRKPIGQTLKGKIQSHAFMVGVLVNKKRRRPLPPEGGVRTLAGGPARKLSFPDQVTNTEVSARLRRNLKINYLVKPFQNKSNDAVKMLKVFFEICFDENKTAKYRRLENLIQAIVRNPFLRRDYGYNSRQAAMIKGFDRLGIDTGQLFNSIKAKVVRQ